jgi:hypothetical protein
MMYRLIYAGFTLHEIKHKILCLSLSLSFSLYIPLDLPVSSSSTSLTLCHFFISMSASSLHTSLSFIRCLSFLCANHFSSSRPFLFWLFFFLFVVSFLSRYFLILWVILPLLVLSFLSFLLVPFLVVLFSLFYFPSPFASCYSIFDAM